MKKFLAFAVILVFVAAAAVVVMFHTPQKNAGGIHAALVGISRPWQNKPWYTLAARVFNLPGGKTRSDQDPPEPGLLFLAGSLEMKMKDGGIYLQEGTGLYVPGATLVFENKSSQKTVEALFTIEIVNADTDEKMYKTRAFINLKPGLSRAEKFGILEGPTFDKPGLAPPMALVVSLDNGYFKRMAIPTRLRRAD